MMWVGRSISSHPCRKAKQPVASNSYAEHAQVFYLMQIHFDVRTQVANLVVNGHGAPDLVLHGVAKFTDGQRRPFNRLQTESSHFFDFYYL